MVSHFQLKSVHPCAYSCGSSDILMLQRACCIHYTQMVCHCFRAHVSCDVEDRLKSNHSISSMLEPKNLIDRREHKMFKNVIWHLIFGSSLSPNIHLAFETLCFLEHPPPPPQKKRNLHLDLLSIFHIEGTFHLLSVLLMHCLYKYDQSSFNVHTLSVAALTILL